ncbi:TPA: Potassium transporter, variant 2 [Trebouxia sp. C0004]
MAGAKISSERWVLDADLEGQKEEQKCKKRGWRSTLALTYSAIGVVYGDVGTSPLYVFSSTFTENTPSETDVLGAMSIIFWTITLIVVVKYMLIVLLADDNGEGGTFALYSLICRFAGMRPANNGVPDASDVTLSHYSRHSGDKNSKSLSRRISFKLKQYLSSRAGAQASLLCLVLLMTSMVLGDGVLTPAQSILGAIYGLQVKTSVSQGAIVGISCAIVVGLFMVQRFGTGRVGVVFAPIILIYFVCNVIIAVTNITRYKPSVFKALSPHYGYYYFRNNHHLGWVQCSGLFLAITGTEAAYADLGHFSRPAIRISFLAICYPVLILTYLGQTAWLTAFPDQVGSTFYASIPYGDGFYWFVFIFATAAACVASQAMISAAFSIIKQSISLGCFPQLTVQHVSDKVLGSVYIPEVNYVMMVLTVVVIAIFKTTVQLGNAYGVAVSSMMFGTTVLMYMVMLMIWETNFFLATAFLIGFGFIDMVFTTANLNKVPHGGWFALAIAGVVFGLSYLWWWGTNTKHKGIVATQVKMQDLLKTDRTYSSKKYDAMSPDDDDDAAEPLTGPSAFSAPPAVEDHDGVISPMVVDNFAAKGPGPAAAANGLAPVEQLLLASTGQPLLRIPAVGLMFADTLYGAPTLLPELVNRWGAVHKILIIITIRQVAVSTVTESERLLFRKLHYPGIYRCVARYGYSDRVRMDTKFVIKLLDKASRQ